MYTIPSANSSAVFEPGSSPLVTVSFVPPSLGRLDEPGHADRALGVDVRPPARVERHRDRAPGLDGDHLAVGGDAAIGVGVASAARRPASRGHPGAVVVADGVVAVGDRLPDPFRRGLDEDRIDVIEACPSDSPAVV